MGGGKRQQSCSSENGSSELHTPPPNVVQTEAPIIEGSSTCGGESSADGRTFEIWKLQLILMVDGIGAVLVVSLIQVYFEEISTSPEQYGYMRSIYYIAQICGGLLIGIGSDTIISKRTAIIISAVGSVIGYSVFALLPFLPNPLYYLLLSRFIVGFSRHSVDAGVGLIAQYITNPLDRPASLGQIGAARTFSLIVGPSLGSTLYSIHKSLPPMASCGLYALNALLAAWLLPDNKIKITKELNRTAENGKVAHSFTHEALNPAFHLGYYKNRFQVDPSVIGYIRSYKGLVSVITKNISRFHMMMIDQQRHDSRAMDYSLLGHLVSSIPLSVISNDVISTMFDCVMMESMPVEVVGSVQAMARILISASGVVAPIYGLRSRWYPVVTALSFMLLAMSWKANDEIWIKQHAAIKKEKKQ